MKIRAGKKLCGRKPAQAPPRAAHSSAAGDRQGLVVGVGELVGEGEERHRADPDHAGGQAVEAVDEVHRVHGGDHHDHAEQRAPGHGSRVNWPRPGQLEGEVLHLVEHQEAGGQHLAAELGERVELEQVVEDPEQRRSSRPPIEHDRRRRGRPAASLSERNGSWWATRYAAHQPAEHRQPAEVRDRHGVHVAVADLGDRAGAQRDLAGDDAEQVGDHGGDQEDE